MQTVVIDARGHMLGRLASILAKQLLNGQQVVCIHVLHNNSVIWESKTLPSGC